MIKADDDAKPGAVSNASIIVTAMYDEKHTDHARGEGHLHPGEVIRIGDPTRTRNPQHRESLMRFLTLLAVTVLTAVVAAQEPKKDKDFPPIPTVDLKRTAPVDYGADIEPIFENKCFVCHSGNVTEGKFDMSTYEKVMKGGAKRGAKVVVPGKSGESFLFLACSRQMKPIMPPKTEEPLTSQELSLVKLWIDEGAKAPTTIRAKEKIIVNLPPALVKPVRAVAVTPDGKSVAASRGNQVHVFESKTPTDAKKGDNKKDWVHVRRRSSTRAQDARRQGREGRAHLPRRVDGLFARRQDARHRQLPGTDALGLREGHTDAFGSAGLPTRSPASPIPWTASCSPPAAVRRPRTARSRSSRQTGKLLADIKGGHSDTVFGVAFSPDGKLLATCGADKFVKVFELPNEGWGWPFGPGPKAPRLAKAFEGHTHHVMGVGWTPDGKKLASCGADNFVKVWDYEKGEKVRDMQGHQKQVTALAFVGKTPQFLTGSAATRACGCGTRTTAATSGTSRAPPTSCTRCSQHRRHVVATGCEDGVVRVYNGTNGQLMKAAAAARRRAEEETSRRRRSRRRSS